MALNKISLFIAIIFITCAAAQNRIEFDHRIKEKIINSYTGTLLLKAGDAVHGIDTKTGKVSWKNKGLKKVSFSSYSEIPYTPIVLFEKKALINSRFLSRALRSKGASKKLLNVVTGQMLFDSEKEGFKAVYNTMILPEKKSVLVDGLMDKDFVISLYSYETGKPLWILNTPELEFFKSLKGTFFDDEKILMDSQQNIYWLKNRKLIKIDGQTGKALFERAGISNIAMNSSKNTLFVFSNVLKAEKLNEETIITAFDTKTQEILWNDPVRITGNVVDTRLDKDKLIAITSKGFDIVDVKSGMKKWDESNPLPLIKKIVPLGRGYLVVQDNFLVKIGENGKTAWQQKIKITHSPQENPLYIIVDGQRALYITPSFANAVEIESGNKIWKQDVILNPTGFIGRNLGLSENHFRVWKDRKRDAVQVYASNIFYIFNLSTLDEPISTEKFAFKDYVPSMKIRQNGYFLYGANLFYFIDLSGNLGYEKEYPVSSNHSIFSDLVSLGSKGFGIYSSALGFVGNQMTRTLNTVLVSKDLGPLTDLSSSVLGTYQSYQGSLDSLTTLNRLDLDSNMSSIFSRVETGRKNDGNQIIVVDKDGEFHIIKMDIDTGEDHIVKKVKNYYSSFLTDQVEQQIYFFEKKCVTIERLK
ncbi:PQQ-like beta-propeller repeat protein [Flagellimonas hymeniacidonis]|uniref:PQQ-like beta-propeller repeat protein n=1 Tax=Flagellimonas hymeniacidonis TaxID=2603628 RepID=A0A5C8V3D2_9FLAO|nr:PQQ-binding-like beta-propeller repeat protein [Flagellimonas hymeniacidonis]TXN34977.1 PQQ-like beta-propeller repeat protein [Flagellimonas hymeniacidonis]